MRRALPWLVFVSVICAARAEPPHDVSGRLRPPPADELPLAAAIDWAQAAMAVCKSRGYPVTATYMDSLREVKLVLRADGARGSTVDVGWRKAYTVIVTGMSSEDYGSFMGYPPGKPIPRPAGKPIGVPPGVSDENLIVAGGGLPVKNGVGKVIGAVSVAGARDGKDAVCAQAGLTKIAPFLK